MSPKHGYYNSTDTEMDTSVKSNTDELADKIVSKLARNSEFKALLTDLINPPKKGINSLKTSVEKLEGEVFEQKNDGLRQENQLKDNRIANLEWHAAQDRLHHIELDQNHHKNSVLISGILERSRQYYINSGRYK